MSAARPTIFCAAFSARQIAESAVKAGTDALAVDFFADSDLRAIARRCELVRGHYPDGFSGDELIAALERVSEGETPIGFVYGAGFEDRPALLAQIAQRWPLLGTDPASLARLKDPVEFGALCDRAGVAFPPTRLDAPEDPAGWLVKQVGGAGGSHVRHAGLDKAGGVGGKHPPLPAGISPTRGEIDLDKRQSAPISPLVGEMSPKATEGGERASRSENGEREGYGRPQSTTSYYQRFVAGERLSLLFAASEGRIVPLGVSSQWCDPSEDEPFRYGGAVGPVERPGGTCEALAAATGRLVAEAFGAGIVISGIASIDFVIRDGEPVCLEINPRFGATVDVFDRFAVSLLQIHVDAVAGRLPAVETLADMGMGTVRASGLVWTDKAIALDAGFAWPLFMRDRTDPPARFEAGSPIATLVAQGTSEAAARAQFAERRRAFLQELTPDGEASQEQSRSMVSSAIERAGHDEHEREWNMP